MSDILEFTGKSVEEALAKAQKHFNLPIARLDVEILDPGTLGFMGLFGKKALIRVNKPASDVNSQIASILGHQKTTSDGADTDKTLVLTANKMSADNPFNIRLDYVEEIIMKICQPLAPIKGVKVLPSNDAVEIEILTDDPGHLIGRKAQTLDALQYLIGRMVSHYHSRPISILLEVEDYRKRRLEQLKNNVLRLASKVEANGRPQTLGPLGIAERKMVYEILKGRLNASSRGHGEFKKVVITRNNKQQTH